MNVNSRHISTSLKMQALNQKLVLIDLIYISVIFWFTVINLNFKIIQLRKWRFVSHSNIKISKYEI